MDTANHIATPNHHNNKSPPHAHLDTHLSDTHACDNGHVTNHSSTPTHDKLIQSKIDSMDNATTTVNSPSTNNIANKSPNDDDNDDDEANNASETASLVTSKGAAKLKKFVSVDETTKTPNVNRLNKSASSSSMKKSLLKSADSVADVERPVFHVQFTRDNDATVIISPTNTAADKSSKRTRNASSSSSSSSSTSSSSSGSSSSSDDETFGLSEARAPDGGYGWVIVFASFVINCIADGITFSFGVIYVEFLDYFGASKSKTAWIGSLNMAMPLLSGPIASFLTDRYGCRIICIAGSLLAAFGFVISAFFADTIEVLFLTFGIIAGFGLSLCYVTSVVIVAYYFDKRRSFASGLAFCGSGIGTFLFAPLIQYLLNEYGWRGTTLVLAGIILNMTVCGCLMRDLPWKTSQIKARVRRQKRERRKKRSLMSGGGGGGGSSLGSISNSASTNTPSVNQTTASQKTSDDAPLDDEAENADERPFSSLVDLPTYINNKEKVPPEVFELLSTNKNLYNILVQNYFKYLIPSRSFSDSARLNELASPTPVPISLDPGVVEKKDEPKMNGRAPREIHTIFEESTPPTRPLVTRDLLVAKKSSFKRDKASKKKVAEGGDNTVEFTTWLNQTHLHEKRYSQPTIDHAQRKLPASSAFLKDLRMHRHSVTYRGAMLNINRYRLRASSCPNIFRNSMTTIARETSEWKLAAWQFWDMVREMFDFSHFREPGFSLFALSNFLLYAWYDVPYVYLTDFALALNFSDRDASFLISLIGIVNMVGEIFLGWLGDQKWCNSGLIYAFCMYGCGATVALMPIWSSYVGLSVLSGGFGLFIAANYSLTSIILVQLTTLDRFTNAYGLLLLVQGVANLIGPPLAGWIYDQRNTYNLTFYCSGAFIAVSGVFLVILPAIKRYRHAVRRSRNDDGQQPSVWRVLSRCFCRSTSTNSSRCVSSNVSDV